IRIETVGETAEGSDGHMSSFFESMIVWFYFFSGDGNGRSEFQISAATFHFPSACFFQTSTYLPRSLIGLPLASLMVISYVPVVYAMSPDLATSTLVVFQLMATPGLASRSFQVFRIASFVVAAGAFVGNTSAFSE